MTSERIMAVLAFAILTGFLGILVWYVPRIDLGIVIAVTVGLAGWDIFGPRKG